MARTLKSDKVLFTATLLLVCLSVVMVYSASALMALERFHSPYLFLIKQGMWAVLGLAALAVTTRIDYRLYKNDALIWGVLAIVALMLVAVLFSAPINGTKRWFNMAGLGIQPSELAKLVIIFFTAVTLERRMHRINEVKYSLAPIAIVVGATMMLILLQPDFGTSVSLALIVAIMVFSAGLSYTYFGGIVLVGIGLLSVVLVSAPYRVQRLITFLDPWADPLGAGFQTIQSLIAVGTGGVFGRGLMAGVQKLFYLPEPHTDFIFAVISEELGLIGATGVLICFVVIAWRGLRISMRAQDSFGAYVALGLTTMIAAQALVNMSVVLSLVPNKGIPLPLVSNGGSSLLINLLGMGVLLNISQHQSSSQ